MDYCKRLKKLRIENGYTQEQIAFILHTRQEQYSKYENGKRELPIKHLIALCCLYRVSADYVLGIENSPLPFLCAKKKSCQFDNSFFYINCFLF